MLAASALGWRALYEELVECKEHARRNMLAYRKRRMLLDQTARRVVNPRKSAVDHKRTRGVIVGYGNASFRSRGPRVQLIRAMVRALRRLTVKRESVKLPSALVFIDEYNTTKKCHRCFEDTYSPLKKHCSGRRVEDHRFRDCPHCGNLQAGPKRWGRDSNAALNILRKLSALLDDTEVPAALARPQGAPP